ncbi:hypothetical protein EGW08_003721 [Elysia chlorotica]|uniref:Uncharacterized protein n=1 Tax=Elysia chlorotica TaxID=188477 RepID=A0A3S1HYC4_ELYCH|nr:hypothetical protein EGW08_003721 [Elysia chlorotica]
MVTDTKRTFWAEGKCFVTIDLRLVFEREHHEDYCLNPLGCSSLYCVRLVFETEHHEDYCLNPLGCSSLYCVSRCLLLGQASLSLERIDSEMESSTYSIDFTTNPERSTRRQRKGSS